MSLQNELESELKSRGADFICFTDISRLSDKLNRGFPNAILLGIVLSREFIREVTESPDYVQNMIRTGKIDEDEFSLKEIQTDRLADFTADCLLSRGYSACSQSENHLEASGYYHPKTKTTVLPHKTIAGYAGLGWIGKHDLLVTPEYGSAICMCTALTNAPLDTVFHAPAKSRCGDCCVCKDVCSVEAIVGNTWHISTSRDELADVYKCTTCLKSMVFCPRTQAYINGSDKR